MENDLTKEIERYYVDIDCMFDIKLTILKNGYESFLKEYFKTDAYWKRTSDSFILGDIVLDSDSFNILYNKRNIEILRYSHLTSIPYIIAKQIQSHFKELEGARYTKTPCILVNSFPYYFTKKDYESLRLLIRRYFEVPIDVDFIRVPYEELTLESLNQLNVCSMILNDALEWIELLDKDVLNNADLKFLKVVTPTILNTKLNPGINEFKTLETIYGSMFDFEFLETKYFCASLNPGEEEIAGRMIESYRRDELSKKLVEEEMNKIYEEAIRDLEESEGKKIIIE